MKPVVAPVKNLLATQIALEMLIQRSYGVPGIGLLHGGSGLGKTTTTTYLYNQVNGIYVSTRAHDTTSSLLQRIVEELGSQPKHRISKNVDFIIEQMSMHERPLFIDEADYLMNDKRMLETIRDLYDGTEVPIVLIGMDQIARRISSHKQFFNRISEWVEFKKADIDDVRVMADSLLEHDIQVDEELLEHLRQATGGELRRITIGLQKIESLAIANDLDLVTLDAWGDQPFHGLRA
ncbi:AAA family ATPase [Vibrio nigripulchritudo]|uniref:AAA family ATPase n=1 Tax=Vibrio nigripulchritudo TaxID=28173 RepID=UPI0003B1867E|nr:AAA family ATPase [Vibrio nigripulchritudo]CCN69752.1 putative Prophage MuSo1, DNA transposition protein [Vibrio nigripulchritudo SFn118]